MDSTQIPVAVWNKFYSLMDKKYFLIVAVDNSEGSSKKISAKCNLCPENKIIKGDDKSVCNFTKHLKACHAQEYKKYVEDRANKRIKLEPQSGTQGTLEQYRTGVTLGKKKNLDNLTVRYIVNAMKPLSTVECPHFRALISELLGDSDSNVQMMDRKTLKIRINSLLHATIKNLQKQLSTAKYVCLTADMWSSYSKGFLGITSHWIDEDMSRKSAALACSRFKGEHTHDRIATELINCMIKYEIPQAKVVCIVTDNGANIVKAFKKYSHGEINDDLNLESDDSILSSDDENKLMENSNDEIQEIPISEILRADGEEVSLPPHFRCAWHTLNLIASKDWLKLCTDKSVTGLYHKAMGKCQKLWNLSTSPKSAEIIHRICNIQLKRPVKTRWNSEYDAVKTILSVADKLEELCETLHVSALSSKEIEFLIEFKSVFAPLSAALDILQGEENMYFGCVLPTLLQLKKSLNDLLPALKYSEKIAQSCLDALDSRFKTILEVNVQHPSHLVTSAICHPFHKLRWFPLAEKYGKTNGTMEELKESFLKLCKLASTTFTTEMPAEEVPECGGFFDYGPIQPRVGSLQQTSELESLKYLLDCTKEGKLVRSVSNFPAIKELFLKFNTGIPSSAPVERLFSRAGLVMTSRRTRLDDGIFETLVLLKANSCFQT